MIEQTAQRDGARLCGRQRLHTVTLSAAREVGEVGGKGAKLGALMRAGFRVPEGFVVTTEAWEGSGNRRR